MTRATFLFEKVSMHLKCDRQKISNSFSSRRCNNSNKSENSSLNVVAVDRESRRLKFRPLSQEPEKAFSLTGCLPLLRVI